MKPDKSAKKRLTALRQELKDAADKDQPPEPQNAAARARALGLALRIVTDLVAGPVVGGGIGWLIDRASGLSPIFLIIFFFLGLAAGVINVMRTARDMNRPHSHHKDQS